MTLTEPYYMVNFNAAACLFEIRVNDVPVLQMELEGQASSKIPCNHAIFSSGKQELSITILPLTGEINLSKNSQFQCSIELYDVSNGFVFKERFDGVETNETEIQSIPIIKKSTFFDATIPYKLKDFWSNGKDLEKVKNLRQKLTTTYLELAKIIEKKDFSAFREVMGNREYNMATSMYLSQKDAEARLNRMIADFKNGFDVTNLAEDARIVYSSYGKKVSLKRPNGEPALSFINEKQQEQIMLDIEFYLPENSDEFQII